MGRYATSYSVVAVLSRAGIFRPSLINSPYRSRKWLKKVNSLVVMAALVVAQVASVDRVRLRVGSHRIVPSYPLICGNQPQPQPVLTVVVEDLDRQQVVGTCTTALARPKDRDPVRPRPRFIDLGPSIHLLGHESMKRG